jgi:arylsulfatase A-like enzyme
LTLSLGAASLPAADTVRPNVLFIMADDHAALAMSACGGRLDTTPHIDRLAREGMRFSRCYVTNSICTPSRAALLTLSKSGYAKT